MNSNVAEGWFKRIERILDAMGVTDGQKVTLATFVLRGVTLNWWEAINRQLTAPLPGVIRPMLQQVTWEKFVKAFNDKYCPESYKYDQEAEFINCKQGRTSVAKYEAKFAALI